MNNLNNSVDESRVYHWTELQGNPFNRAITPYMLFLEKGDVILTKALIKKESREQQFRKIRQVKYDKEYVFTYLVSKLFRPLGVRHRETIHNLIDRAFDYYLLTEELQEQKELFTEEMEEMREQRKQALIDDVIFVALTLRLCQEGLSTKQLCKLLKFSSDQAKYRLPILLNCNLVTCKKLSLIRDKTHLWQPKSILLEESNNEKVEEYLLDRISD